MTFDYFKGNAIYFSTVKLDIKFLLICCCTVNSLNWAFFSYIKANGFLQDSRTFCRIEFLLFQYIHWIYISLGNIYYILYNKTIKNTRLYETYCLIKTTTKLKYAKEYHNIHVRIGTTIKQDYCRTSKAHNSPLYSSINTYCAIILRST